MRVDYTDVSRRNLAEIGDRIALDNPAAAGRQVDRIIDASESLSDMALRYPSVEYGSIRKMPIDSDVVLYRVTTRVEVLRVIHTAMDWVLVLNDLE